MIETLAAIVILGFSTWRCLSSPLAPWLTLIYIHTLAYWLRLRVEFFYENRNILNYFILLLTVGTFVYHASKDRSFLRSLTPTHTLILIILAYSWISLSWSPGYEAYLSFNSHTFRNVIANQAIYTLVLPALFIIGMDKVDIRGDLRLIGLTVLPLVVLTTDFEGRSAQYLFLAIDPATGDIAEASSNPLQIAYFGSVMLMFATIFMERRLPILLANSAIAVLSAYLMLLSQSRGQLISTIVILMLLLPFRSDRMRARHLLVFGPISLFFIGLFALNVSEIFRFIFTELNFDYSYIERFSGADLSSSWEARMEFLTTVAYEWSQSAAAVLFGLGTAASFAIVGIYIHNVFVEAFLEQGVFIGIACLAFVIYTVRDIFTALDLTNVSRYQRRFLLFVSAQFIAQILIALKQGTLTKSMDLLSHAIFSSIYARHLILQYGARPVQKPARPSQPPQAQPQATSAV